MSHFGSAFAYSGGVFNEDSTNDCHAMTLMGWGTDAGKDYWLIANSHGVKWWALALRPRAFVPSGDRC